MKFIQKRYLALGASLLAGSLQAFIVKNESQQLVGLSLIGDATSEIKILVSPGRMRNIDPIRSNRFHSSDVDSFCALVWEVDANGVVKDEVRSFSSNALSCDKALVFKSNREKGRWVIERASSDDCLMGCMVVHSPRTNEKGEALFLVTDEISINY